MGKVVAALLYLALATLSAFVLLPPRDPCCADHTFFVCAMFICGLLWGFTGGWMLRPYAKPSTDSTD